MIKDKFYFLVLAIAAFSLTSCAQQKFIKSDIAAKVNKTAEWQMNNFSYSTEGAGGYLHDYGMDAWTNAVLYMGMYDWAATTGNEDIFNWLYKLGEENEWKVPANFSGHNGISLYHADEMTIGNFYLAMYGRYDDSRMLDSIRERADFIITNPPREGMNAGNKQKWTWCDALFMAPSVYVSLSNVLSETQYREFMHSEMMDTYQYLYDKEHKLFFRDDSYFEKREKNGEKVFWGRGNGWVIAGLANILKQLPENAEIRPFYEDLYLELMESLLSYRNDDGFWHASLLDTASYPAPETSATALITYALAYGINSGLLNKKEYTPQLEKSWKALLSVINGDGKLGYVQPIGADPRNVTKDMTAVYGVGAFMMAGSEIYKMAK